MLRNCVLAVAFSVGCTPRDCTHQRHENGAVSAPSHGASPGASAAVHDAEQTKSFREILGLNVKFSQGQPLSELPMLTDLGVRWVRDTVDWCTLEPRPGHYVEFPPEFKRRLAFYKENGIGIVFLLAYHNTVAYRPTKEEPLRAIDPAAFGRYAVAVAKQLKASGVPFVLEIWNEPHNFVIRPLVSGSWNGKPPAPWVDHYLKMAKEAVSQVKAFDPTIKLLSDDDMWIIHYWYLEAGLPDRLDGFAFHPYTLAAPEKAAVNQDTDWVRPFTVVDPDSSFASAVRRLREQGRTKLGRVPEMWITEWGWKLGQHSPYGPVTEELLGAFLPRAYVLAAAARVEVVCWFSAQDSVDGPMGLVSNDGRRRKPYYALKTLAEQLGGMTLRKQVWGSEHRTSGTQAYLFSNKRESTLIVWSIEDSKSRLALSGPLRDAKIISALGGTVAPEATEHGERYLTLGMSPFYLTFPRDLDSFGAEAAPGLRPNGPS